jgi:hypothetical protein
MLTPPQLDLLRQDLSGLANIEYDEVMTELLDHYASLTERKMALNMSFEDASKWAWAELGSGEGLQQIQTDYEKSIKKQVRVRHFSIIKSYFGWPIAFTTVLTAGVIYRITPFIPAVGMMALFICFALAPALVVSYGTLKHMNQHRDSRKIIWTYLYTSGTTGVSGLYYFWLSGWGSFTDVKRATWLFQLHSTVSTVLCLLALLYAVSFIQLFKENFSLKLT